MTMTTLGHSPRITLSVTSNILSEAMVRNSNHCMLAEALKKANPKLKYVSVDIQTIRATDINKGERYVWLTPRSAQLAIVKFDRGEKISPFSVTLRDGQTVSARRNQKRYEKKKKSKLRRPKNGAASSVPVRIGGQVPPRSVGRRRQFGLRSLEY